MDRFPGTTVLQDRRDLAAEEARDAYECGANLAAKLIDDLKKQRDGAIDPSAFDSAIALVQDAKSELQGGADAAQAQLLEMV